jgi:putative transposase
MIFVERGIWDPSRNMENKVQNRRRLRLNHFAYRSHAHVYFIAICTVNREPYFSDGEMAEVIEEELKLRMERREIKLSCYCIMPDHLHLLLSLTDEYPKKLQDWISAFKRYTTKIIGESYNVRPLWQKNFYDHVVRGEKSLVETARYIIHNPVRKGIVTQWEEYPFSKMVNPLPIGGRPVRGPGPTDR